MNFLSKLFGKKPAPAKNDQAVIVHLDAMGLGDEVYEKYDLSTIEDQLIEVIDSRSLGEFDGNEVGGGEAVLFMYGPNAEALFAAIEPTLRAYPLCRNAKVVIRQGPPGAREREVQLREA